MDENAANPMNQPAAGMSPDFLVVDPQSSWRAGMDAQLATLPTYARALLQIRVPVTVTLAAQRKPIQEILELGPGSIVKFDKTCDEPLELMVGERVIATGEVVKVGDKFGLRVGARQ
jgi:flagellar motor switch protein FliN